MFEEMNWSEEQMFFLPPSASLYNGSKCAQNVEAVFEAKDLMQPCGRGWSESDSEAQRGVKHQMPADCQWEKALGLSYCCAPEHFRARSLYVVCAFQTRF